MYKVIGNKNKFTVVYIDVNDNYLVYKSNHVFKDSENAVLVASIMNTYSLALPLDWKQNKSIDSTVDKTNFIKSKIIDIEGKKWQDSQNSN